jgi:hypothetical protein
MGRARKTEQAVNLQIPDSAAARIVKLISTYTNTVSTMLRSSIGAIIHDCEPIMTPGIPEVAGQIPTPITRLTSLTPKRSVIFSPSRR